MVSSDCIHAHALQADWNQEADDRDSWGTILLPPPQPIREGLHTLQLSCTPSFANKSFFLETHQEVYLFWALADQTLFLAPYNASCTVFHHNLVSIGWHMSKWTQVWFSDNLFSLKQLLWIRTFLRSEACCKASAYGICETGHKWKKVILYFITRTIFTPWEFLMSLLVTFSCSPTCWGNWLDRMAEWPFGDSVEWQLSGNTLQN